MSSGTDSTEYDIFVSYARADENRVGALVDALRLRGLNVWWDRHIAVGGGFRNEIETALTTSRLILVCWTPASVASEFVREEASAAKGANKYFPVLLKSADLPIGFREANALKLAGWDPFKADQSLLDRLCDQISERINRSLETTHRIQRSNVTRRWTEFVLSVVLSIALAALTILVIAELEPGGDPVIATALRVGLALAAGVLAVFAFGAVTGRGFRGAGLLPRAGIGLAALFFTGAMAPLAQPALAPGALVLQTPEEIRMVHSDPAGVNAETEAFLRTDVALILPLGLTRNGAPSVAHVKSIEFELTLGNRVLGFRALHYTNLSPGEASGWIPGLGAMNLPARLGVERPSQVRMVPLAPLSWAELLETLTTDGRKRMAGLLTVTLSSGKTLSQRCSVSAAQDLIRMVEETPSIRGRPAMSIPLQCDERL